MLTKEECEKALDCLADDDKMDELAQKFSMDDDYTSNVNYEMARKWCYDQLKQCIDEHFDNPPLEWEEIKECNVVYDKEQKKYRLIEDILESGKRIVFTNTIDSFITENYESNRFYRKEVVQE